jgi:hypothetical protein
MAFRLREDLHWCLCGEQVVFLDIHADRYFCLPVEGSAAFLRAAAGDIDAADVATLGSLIDRQMLIEDPESSGVPPTVAVESVTGDLFEDYLTPHALDVLEAFAAEIKASSLLRRKALGEILKAAAASTRIRRQPDGRRSLRRIVSATRAVSLVLRATDRCLVRALAVHATCRRHGLHPSLVFGVRLHPFGAHCWVQVDDKVLVGDFEQARLYTPILALG